MRKRPWISNPDGTVPSVQDKTYQIRRSLTSLEEKGYLDERRNGNAVRYRLLEPYKQNNETTQQVRPDLVPTSSRPRPRAPSGSPFLELVPFVPSLASSHCSRTHPQDNEHRPIEPLT